MRSDLAAGVRSSRSSTTRPTGRASVWEPRLDRAIGRRHTQAAAGSQDDGAGENGLFAGVEVDRVRHASRMAMVEVEDRCC